MQILTKHLLELEYTNQWFVYDIELLAESEGELHRMVDEFQDGYLIKKNKVQISGKGAECSCDL